MRVIAGEFRSRVLEAPHGWSTRPTSDRLRETLFNVLATRVDGAQFLDLYAGTGAVGIEAISRGAAGCVLVEEAPAAVRVLRTNLAKLGIASRVQVEAASVEKALSRTVNTARKVGVERAGFDLVFLDPPYEAAAEYEATLGALGRHAELLLRAGATVIAEHGKKATLAERYGALERHRVLQQGDAALSFFSVVGEG